MSMIFPLMIVIVLIPTIVGIKVGARKMARVLYWLVIGPLVFILTELIRVKLIGGERGILGTILIIFTFLILSALAVTGWLYWEKTMKRFFPAGKRPAGGAISGALIGIYLSMVFLALMITLHPSYYQTFKFPIFNGLYVEIDVTKSPFSKFHGKMERFGKSLFTPSQDRSQPEYSDDGSYPDYSPFNESSPETLAIDPTQETQPKDEDIPVWALPPPDQSWDIPPPDPADVSGSEEVSSPSSHKSSTSGAEQKNSTPPQMNPSVSESLEPPRAENVTPEQNTQPPQDPAEGVPRERTEGTQR